MLPLSCCLIQMWEASRHPRLHKIHHSRNSNKYIIYYDIYDIPYHTPYRTVPYRTIPYRTVPYRTVPYRTVPYHTIPYHTIPYHTIPYHTIPSYGSSHPNPRNIHYLHHDIHFKNDELLTIPCHLNLS